MATIKSTLSAVPGITTPIIIVLYKSTAPTAEVARVVKPAPHPSPYNFQFTGLQDGVYIVNIHDSVDGTTLGNLRHDYWIDAATNQIIGERIFFVVDGPGANDPVSGATQYVNTYLNGKTVSGVFQEGYRYLRPGIEWNPLAGGGVELINGLVFDGGMVWSIEIDYTVAVPTVVNNDAFSEIVIINDDVSLSSVHYNKCMMVRGSAAAQVTTLPFTATIPDGKGFVIFHDGGDSLNVKVLAQTGESIRFRGAAKNYILLAKGEFVKVIKFGSTFYCNDFAGQFDRVGQKLAADIVAANQLVCDGLITYDGNIYQRIYEHILNDVPSNQRVTFADFDVTQTINGVSVFVNRGFFAVDIPNKLFKLPDLRDRYVRFIKNVGGVDVNRVSNVPGGFQGWQVGTHDHALPSDASGLTNTQSLVHSANSDEGFNNSYRTDYNAVGAENRTANIAMLPVILI